MISYQQMFCSMSKQAANRELVVQQWSSAAVGTEQGGTKMVPGTGLL